MDNFRNVLAEGLCWRQRFSRIELSLKGTSIWNPQSTNIESGLGRSRGVHWTTINRPPYSVWVVRADQEFKQIVMAYFGIQFKGNEKREKALAAPQRMVASFGAMDGAGHYDLTQTAMRMASGT